MSFLGDRPKRPLSSWMLWMKESGRKQIKSENPGLRVTEVAAMGGALWRRMGESEKSQWKKSASEAMEKYKEEVKLWKSHAKMEKKHLKKRGLPKASQFADTSAKPTFFVYDSSDHSFSPICMDCFLKCSLSHWS
ncbi:high mobility group protein Z-like [Drosophila elegans]|uniref:high mobility group protein Z-like n=1 Tax=Drosophila elegans TaxID=30023 RepID=UPI0007E5E037|nr:high mobility group protein Z-like [Drosophila elegans]